MAGGLLRRVRARRCALGRQPKSDPIQYAMNTQAVNGEKGKGNFKPEAGAAEPERLGPLFIR
jgi:hypothetical protein